MPHVISFSKSLFVDVSPTHDTAQGNPGEDAKTKDDWHHNWGTFLSLSHVIVSVGFMLSLDLSIFMLIVSTAAARVKDREPPSSVPALVKSAYLITAPCGGRRADGRQPRRTLRGGADHVGLVPHPGRTAHLAAGASL